MNRALRYVQPAPQPMNHDQVDGREASFQTARVQIDAFSSDRSGLPFCVA
jgi:hypothetical protein